MSDKSFEHLFPSPGLEEVFKGSKKQQNQKKITRQNYHLNSQIFQSPQAKIEEEAANYRKMIAENRYRFLSSIGTNKNIKGSLNKKRIPTSLQPRGRTETINREAQKDLYQKIQFHKTALEQTPMIFMQGKISLMECQNYSAQLQISKVINYTQKKQDSISCRVIAVKKKLDKNEIHLKPYDYQIVLAGYLPPLKPRSSLINVSITGKWVSQPNKTRLYLLLINQVNTKILYVTRCQNLHQIAQKAMEYEKIDQILY